MAGFGLPFSGKLRGAGADSGQKRGKNSKMKKKQSSAEKGVTLIAANTEVCGGNAIAS